jgi:hypothetical protein
VNNRRKFGKRLFWRKQENTAHPTPHKPSTNSMEQSLPKKLTVPQLIKKFPAFHGTRRFITAFTTARPELSTWSKSIFLTVVRDYIRQLIKLFPRFSDCLTLKIKAICSSETSVTMYQSARRNILEQLNLERFLPLSFLPE